MKTALALPVLAAASAAIAHAQALPGPVSPTLTGEQVYVQVCQACHMADAKGAVGAGRIASLAANPNLEYPEYPIAVVTGGKGPMPWFRGVLTDGQIADVVTYVRTHFGNHYRAPVTAAQVVANGVAAPHESER